MDGQEEYEVKEILSHCTFGRQKQLQYLVKWKGYLSSDNTWEPAGNLHTDELIQKYRQRTMQLRATHSQGIHEVLVKLKKREWQRKLRQLWQQLRTRAQKVQNWKRMRQPTPNALQTPPSFVYPHEVSPHYWDDTEPIVR